jgi:hypothetical protein
MGRDQAFGGTDQFHQIIENGARLDQPLAGIELQHRHAADRIELQSALGVGGHREVLPVMRHVEHGHRHGNAARVRRKVAADQRQHISIL